MMKCPRVAVFDMDDTLAESFEAPKLEMVERLKRLLSVMEVAILTGRDFARIEPDFLPHLVDSTHMDKFFLLPEASAECMQWQKGTWETIYATSMSREEFDRIRAAIEICLQETGAYEGLPQFGERFVEKHAMLAFASLGIKVPSDLKYTWDPGNIRRQKLWQAMSRKLPEFDVLMGGATSIDVTKKGVDKASGIRFLSDRLQIPPSEMLYVGDALYEGGNDYVVIPTGIQTRSTSGPEETLGIIDEILAACAAQ